MNIDPGTITFVQTTFLQHLNNAFLLTTQYALNLLYIFAIFEVVCTGLIWAVQQDVVWGRIFFKIIKIGLIFFIIQNYASLLDVLIRGFAQLGGIVANTSHLSQVVFNPAKVWQYGYDIGIILLKSAATSGVGLALIQVIIGMGILFVFGLLGIQIVLQVVGFYLIAFIALILLPFGAFNPGENMFEKAVQVVLKAGVRVMVLIMVMGIAVTVWNTFHLAQITNITTINQPLGLLFTGLLFLYLAVRLPQYGASAVGHILMRFTGDLPASVVKSAPEFGGSGFNTVSDISHMQAATAVTPLVGQANAALATPMAAVAVSSQMSPSTVNVQMSSPSSATNMSSDIAAMRKEFLKGSMQAAHVIEKSISQATLQKLKKTFLQALKEQQDHHGIE